MELYVEWRLNRSNLFDLCFLPMLAGETVVDSDERNVPAIDSVVVAVIAHVIGIELLVALWSLEVMKVLLWCLPTSSQMLLLILWPHWFHQCSPFFLGASAL